MLYPQRRRAGVATATSWTFLDGYGDAEGDGGHYLDFCFDEDPSVLGVGMDRDGRPRPAETT
ncbi:hypothetical protein GCM10020218_068050 [Dactylosporangium vinaceum]